MLLVVVNDKDEVIGSKDRAEENKDDITRVAGLWIINSNSEMLIAQRSFNKEHDPGKWGPAAAGTVEEGETYISNVIKEAGEELGITIKEEQLITGSHKFRETSHKYFSQSFIVKLDIPIEDFTIQRVEVESIRWVPIEELTLWIKEKPQDFIASFPDSFEGHKDLINNLIIGK